MRNIYFFLIILLFNTHLAGYAQQITYSAKNVPLKTVFAAIQKQTGYGFFYDKTILSRAKPVTVNVTKAPIKDVLSAIFKNQSLAYSIENKTILVSRKKAPVKSIAKATVKAKNKEQHLVQDTIKYLQNLHPVMVTKPQPSTDTLSSSPAPVTSKPVKSSPQKPVTDGFVIAKQNPSPAQMIPDVLKSSVAYATKKFGNPAFAPLDYKKTTFGVKGGFSTSRREGWQRGSGSTDFYLAFFADKQMTSKINLSTELGFALLGRTSQYEIPVHVKYKLNERWNVLAGPKLDIMGERYSRRYIGLSADVGSQYQINQIFFAEARFGRGLISQDINVLRLGIGANFSRNESIEERSDKSDPLRLRVGLNGGVATTYGFGAVAGFDFRIQEDLSSFATATLTAGFSHYWRDPDYIEYMNYFPLKAGLKLFPVNTFYVAPEAGFAFGLDNESDSRPFVYAAGIGAQLKNGFDVSLRYEKISGQIGTYYFGMPVVKNPAYFALRAEYGVNFRPMENKSAEFREAKEPPAWRGTHKKSVFLELMGHGMGVTGNFDMRLRRDQNDGLGFSAGAGYTDQNFTMPLTLNYIVGKGRSGFEAGIGVTGLISKSSYDNFFWGPNETKESFMAVGVVGVGYRLQSYNGFMLRANLTAVYDGLYFNKFFHPEGLFYIHIPGLSIGYNFR